MKSFVRKMISMLLALAVIIGVAAAGDFSWLNVKSYADGVPSGGKCGDEAYWTFDGSKLVIGGKGEMYEYNPAGDLADITKEGDNCVPWRSFKDKIKNIEIGYGITNIAEWAFEGSSNLTSVNISGTVEAIGRNAFESCSKLSEVKLNNGIKEIGAWAFLDCTSLEGIEFPASLKNIGREAFGGCGLKSVSLPNTLELIGRDAFSMCTDLASVSLPDNLEIINRGLFFGCEKITDIVIPETVKEIGRSAFDSCTGLKKIDIPDSVETIGMDAFNGCTNLNKINMSKNITYIDEGAFADTGYYNNESNWVNGVLYIDEYLIAADDVQGNYHIKTGTRCVARHAFECCDGLTGVIVPASVTSFSYNPFYECSNLNKVVFIGRKTGFNDIFATNEADMTFYCFSDSDAYNYAQEKGIKCVSMDGLKTGDATGDKIINSSDALLTLQHAVGQITLTDDRFTRGDVTRDNVINSSDALKILQYAVGQIDKL